MFAMQPSSCFRGWQRKVCVSFTFRCVCSSTFVADFREEVRIIIPAIVEYLKDSDWHVRNAAIEFLSRVALRGMC